MFLKKLYEAAGREFNFKLHVSTKSVVFIPEARTVEISFTPLEFKGNVDLLDEEFISNCAEHAKSKFEEMDSVDKVLGGENPKEEEPVEIPEEPQQDNNGTVEEPPQNTETPKESIKTKYGSMF